MFVELVPDETRLKTLLLLVLLPVGGWLLVVGGVSVRQEEETEGAGSFSIWSWTVSDTEKGIHKTLILPTDRNNDNRQDLNILKSNKN